MFRFKQFTVHDEACGMKVGTDAVLLGTEEAPLPKPSTPTEAEGCLAGLVNSERCFSILDVGTGSGVVALMLAQRYPEAQVMGIDIDEAAARQAAANFAASPFKNRLKAVHTSLQELCTMHFALCTTEGFDLIVSNPPYFVDSLKNPDEARRTARHTDSLSFEELTDGAAQLLRDGGLLQVIVPTDAEQAFQHPTFVLLQRTYIRTTAKKAPKRVILTLQKKATLSSQAGEEDCEKETVTNELILMGPNGEPRSAAYQERAFNFYL